VNPAALLRRVETKLVERLERLEERLNLGSGKPELNLETRDVDAAWVEYAQIGAALATITAATTPGAGGRLLTTSELAAAYGVSKKTILRKRKAGVLNPAAQLGERGRAALRW
jgi:hypothetical protein